MTNSELEKQSADFCEEERIKKLFREKFGVKDNLEVTRAIHLAREEAKKEFIKNIKEDMEYQRKNLTGDFEEDKPIKWRLAGMRHLLTQVEELAQSSPNTTEVWE